MKAHGFYLAAAGGASDDFKKPPCTIEFHQTLFTEEKDFNFTLDAWKRAKREDGTHRYIIDKEDNFIYSVCHMYKHYCFGGCGVRFLCDLYLLTEKDSYDWDYINSTLEAFGILDFCLRLQTLFFEAESLRKSRRSC